MSEWVQLAELADINPDYMSPVEYGEHYLAIALIDGQVYVFDDTCTHEECQLSDGELEDKMVTCPCHESMFSVETGEVFGGPAERPIRTYPARLVDGHIDAQI